MDGWMGWWDGGDGRMVGWWWDLGIFRWDDGDWRVGWGCLGSDQDMKEKVHLVFASLFTDRAISYRHDRGAGGTGSGAGSRD